MTTKQRYQKVIEYFSEHAPDPQTELKYESTYELLVAVILSAQCTDKRVNIVTPPFYKKFPNTEFLSKATIEEVFDLIRSVSYPNNKTKHLIGMAIKVQNEFNGIIPLTVDQLTTLPGVGRKTANVVTSVIDSQPNMAVDTHVFRVSARIGLTKNAKTPLATEKQLIANIPTNLVHLAHHWLILHGRYVCKAQNPQCQICGLRAVCRYYNTIK